MSSLPVGSVRQHLKLVFDVMHGLYLTFMSYCTNLSCVIEVSCWILTGERQTAVIRSNYVQVLLNQDMSFFDTYGNNGDIVSQVLSDVLLIQSALSEKVSAQLWFIFVFSICR